MRKNNNLSKSTIPNKICLHSLNDALLTKRQMEVLKYMVLGYTAKRIALKLGISFRTVETYMETLKLKLNCHTKGELIEKAIMTGLVDFSHWEDTP